MKKMNNMMNDLLDAKGLKAIGPPYLEGDKWLVPVVKKDIFKQIEDHIKSFKRHDEIVEAINNILNYSNYLFRLYSLSPDELKDFYATNEGPKMTDEMKQMFNDASPEQQKYYLNLWSQGLLQRRNDWLQYLFWDTEEKPSLS